MSETHRLFVYNGGFLRQRVVRRILGDAGYAVTFGLPRRPDDLVGVWGHSPTARRGEAVARRHDRPLVRIEDAFLRSLFPGRQRREAPLGVLVDHRGAHYDPRQPSDLEVLLKTNPLDDAAVLSRAREGIQRLRDGHLSKYAALRPDLALPPPGYVLVVDQLRGDASVRLNGGDRARFVEMLVRAQEDHPGARIVIKTHPETANGLRPGFLGPQDVTDRVSLLTDPVSNWDLLEGAIAVYTLSSQLGFEAILAGHRPVVFGQPFYAGWGRSQDERPLPRRARNLTATQLFAGAMILYPKWDDPYHQQAGGFETALGALEARARAWREDRQGWICVGLSAWKRRRFAAMFGCEAPLMTAPAVPNALRRKATTQRRVMVWASKAPADVADDVVQVEDGFLRSRGLGAALTPPMSLALDDVGIYYDSQRPSRLEHLITRAAARPPDQLQRAERLIARLRGLGLSKYNVGGGAVLPPCDRRRVLVVGQVADDASVRLGAGPIATDLALLEQARQHRPEAEIVYKPHPDVEAGLRAGGAGVAALADHVVQGADPIALLDQVDEVWTMTSLLGFEALLRGVRVCCTGMPFYAGWGLTQDHLPAPERRRARPSVAALVQAVLIDYPRYYDPVTKQPCPVEVVLDRLADPAGPTRGTGLSVLAQGQRWLKRP